MTTSDATEKKPLWLFIEENILGLESQDLSGESLEASIQRLAGELDNAGYNVSHHGGNMLQLRWAMNAASKVGRPLMQDLNAAIETLTLEDAADAYSATDKIMNDIAQTWPEIKKSERRADIIKMVEQTKLDLLIARATDMPDDEGIRMLIEEEVGDDVGQMLPGGADANWRLSPEIKHLRM